MLKKGSDYTAQTVRGIQKMVEETIAAPTLSTVSQVSMATDQDLL
jgi:hypothetical protein